MQVIGKLHKHLPGNLQQKVLSFYIFQFRYLQIEPSTTKKISSSNTTEQKNEERNMS